MFKHEPLELRLVEDTENEGEVRELPRAEEEELPHIGHAVPHIGRDLPHIGRDLPRVEPAPSTQETQSEGEMIAGRVGTLVDRVAGTSVEQIDTIIAELQALRDTLEAEDARVQRRLHEYTTLNQAAMQSTRIIAESLSALNKTPRED